MNACDLTVLDFLAQHAGFSDSQVRHLCDWWQACRDLGVDVAFYAQRERPMSELLPWDHINVKKGRAYLAKEQERSLLQLQVMAGAT